MANGDTSPTTTAILLRISHCCPIVQVFVRIQ